MQNETTSAGRTGLILLAHGSRDALWRQPIEAVLKAVQQTHPQSLAACAYLEACAPDLPTAARGLVEAGATHITVLPLFLGTGKHAREDIPKLVQEISDTHPQVAVDLSRPWASIRVSRPCWQNWHWWPRSPVAHREAEITNRFFI